MQTLICALLATFLAADEPALDIPTEIVDSEWAGELRHKDGTYPVKIKLEKEDGVYIINDGESTAGTLTLLRWSPTTSQALFRWRDKFGKGYLRVTYSKDFKSFEGTWWNQQIRSHQGKWNGKRRES